MRRIFCHESGATRSCLILPTWNHLWFVAYLWVYTLLLIALVGGGSKIVGLVEAKLPTFVVGALLLPAAILCGARVFLFPIFRETHALADDWYAHAVYFLVFAFGFFIARAETIWNAIERWRWTALILAVAAYSIVIITRFVLVDPSLLGQLTPVRQCAYGLQQWFAILAALGFGRRWLNFRDSPTRRYFTDAVFPYYIVHQTIIVAVVFALKPHGFTAASEAAIVIAATVVGCAATYEIVRRLPPLRPLFGLKPPARPAFAAG